MKKWKLFFAVLFFTSFICFFILFFSFPNKSSQIPSEEGNISVFFCPQEDCEFQLLFYINESDTSIDCAFYDLNLPSVITLLEEKENVGVSVRIVVDADNKAAASALSFVHFDTRTAYMHDKFCIFDNKQIMTGSMNPTVSDATQNNNNILFISSPSLVQNYNAEFSSLWNGKFGADDVVKIPQFKFNNFTLENYFCPEDDCEQHILDVLTTANTSIHFLEFSFTSDAIGHLLIEKGTKLKEPSISGESTSVEIAGVMEKSQNNAYTEYEKLHHFFNVSWDGNPHFLHDKVFIVDHAIVITGSMNPSKNGNEKNDENILIIHNPEIAQLYEEEFERLEQDAQSDQS